MGHHKRKRPKDRRGGCLFCKPHKSNANKDRKTEQTMQERRACEAERQAFAEGFTDSTCKDSGSGET